MRSCTRQVLSLSLLSLLCAVPAAAQFKPKLSKLNPLAKKESAPAARTPTFNERVLEITDGRVDQLLKGYAAEAAALEAARGTDAEARAAYEEENRGHPARLKSYEASHREWQSCQDRVVKPAEAKARADMQRSQDEITGGDDAAFERKMEDVRKRIEAAQARGDMAEVMRLADSLQQHMGMKSGAAAARSSAEMQAAANQCGAEPERPEPPTPPSTQQPNLDAAGAAAAGLTAEQYAILKERVQYAVGEDGKVRVASSEWAFAPAEIAVLEKRGPELQQAYGPIRTQGY